MSGYLVAILQTWLLAWANERGLPWVSVPAALAAGALLGAWGAPVLLFGAAGYATLVVGFPACVAGMALWNGVSPWPGWGPVLRGLGWLAANEALLIAAGGAVLGLRARWTRRRGPHDGADLT